MGFDEKSDLKSFVCDEMLLKFSRWLRMAGYDVITPRGTNNTELTKISIEEGRILLTRNRDLPHRKGITAIRIISDDLHEQMIEFKQKIPRWDLSRGFSRCSTCNGELHRKKSSEASVDGYLKDRIRKQTLEYYSTLFICQDCGKVFWEGSHWSKIKARLMELGMEPHLPH